ncbi:MAG: hypothetical protein ACHREM_10660 [Polyangiales bacterium]
MDTHVPATPTHADSRRGGDVSTVARSDPDRPESSRRRRLKNKIANVMERAGDKVEALAERAVERAANAAERGIDHLIDRIDGPTKHPDPRVHDDGKPKDK